MDHLLSRTTENIGSNPLKLFHLVSRNRILKFTGPWTIPIVRLSNPSRQFSIMGREGYLQAILAMRQHRSQLVWFRYLYLIFSRYMYINEWVEWKASWFWRCDTAAPETSVRGVLCLRVLQRPRCYLAEAALVWLTPSAFCIQFLSLLTPLFVPGGFLSERELLVVARRLAMNEDNRGLK